MKTFYGLVLCLLFATVTIGQSNFWSVYNFKVDAGDEAKVLSALDDFFTSNTGKALPPATINGLMFGNSDQDFTHQVIFFAPINADFTNMYSGYLASEESFILLTSILDRYSSSAGSYLGKALDISPNPNARYSQQIMLSISDPATYLKEFKIFKAGVAKQWPQVTLDLHQFLSGGESGVSHVAVIHAPSFEMMMDFADKIYTTPGFQNFASKVSGIRKLVNNNSMVTIKNYNQPN